MTSGTTEARSPDGKRILRSHAPPAEQAAWRVPLPALTLTTDGQPAQTPRSVTTCAPHLSRTLASAVLSDFWRAQH